MHILIWIGKILIENYLAEWVKKKFKSGQRKLKHKFKK